MTRQEAIEAACRNAAKRQADWIEPQAAMAARCAPFYGATLGGGPRKPIDGDSVMRMALMFPHGTIASDLHAAIRQEFRRLMG